MPAFHAADGTELSYRVHGPATSVPAGQARGLPAGLMIVGRHFGDATCLRVARAFEAAFGGFPRPSLS